MDHSRHHMNSESKQISGERTEEAKSEDPFDVGRKIDIALTHIINLSL